METDCREKAYTDGNKKVKDGMRMRLWHRRLMTGHDQTTPRLMHKVLHLEHDDDSDGAE